MPKKQHFDILLLIARPAAGKSEIISYLKEMDPVERLERFHVSEFEEIDDFPMLWTWFEEDRLLTQMGYPRMYTDDKGIFLGHHLWDLLIEMICLEYAKKIRYTPEYHQDFNNHHRILAWERAWRLRTCLPSAFSRSHPEVSDSICKRLLGRIF